MTLVNKINLLKTVLNNLKEDSALALTIQGLYTEAANIKVADIPNLILQIRAHDFNYKFDFKALDSVGSIHVRNEGTTAGGMQIAPVPFDFVVPTRMDLNVDGTIQLVATNGVYGRDLANIGFSIEFPTITHKKLDFKSVSVEPEQFIAPSEED